MIDGAALIARAEAAGASPEFVAELKNYHSAAEENRIAAERAIVAEPRRAADPLTEIAGLIREGKTDAATVGELVRLHTFVADRRARQEFFEAMQACQAELKAVVKNDENPQTRSRYANLEAIGRTAQPIIAKHGFSLSFGTADARAENEVQIICTVRHVGGCSEMYRLDLPRDGIGAKGNPIGQMNPVQAIGSTTSYGRRYLTILIFNLTIANEDDDANAAATLMIDGTQVEAINRLLESCRAAGHPVDMAKFLQWAINCAPRKEGEEPLSLADVPAKRFAEAVNFLTRRLAEGPSKPKGGTK